MADVFKVTGLDDIAEGLSSMMNEMEPASEQALDKLAVFAANKMSAEAPKMTGLLSSEITVAVTKGKRTIEPTAKNWGGKKYALAVEEGSKEGYIPNVLSIERWFGVDRKTAWAIAYKIQQTGTKANPFVMRTFNAVVDEMDAIVGEMVNRIVVSWSTAKRGL